MNYNQITQFRKRYFFTGWNGNAKWILEACEALANIQGSLTEEEFFELTAGIFDKRNIQRLVRIGSDYRFHDPVVRDKLPNSYGTIDKLCCVSETIFYELVDYDLITPYLRRTEVEEFLRGKGQLHASYLRAKGIEDTSDQYKIESAASNSSSKSSLKEFASKLELNLSEPKSDKK